MSEALGFIPMWASSLDCVPWPRTMPLVLAECQTAGSRVPWSLSGKRWWSYDKHTGTDQGPRELPFPLALPRGLEVCENTIMQRTIQSACLWSTPNGLSLAVTCSSSGSFVFSTSVFGIFKRMGDWQRWVGKSKCPKMGEASHCWYLLPWKDRDSIAWGKELGSTCCSL